MPGKGASALSAPGPIATTLSLPLPAFELVCPALGKVLPSLLCTAAIGLPGLRSFAPGPPVVFLRSPLVPVGDPAPVARVMLPVALAALTSCLC